MNNSQIISGKQSSFLLPIVREGLEFILSHFEEPIWPRAISTLATNRTQIMVYNQEEALARFRQSNFMDCRISAYSSYVEYKGMNRQAPSFLFPADLDCSNFTSVQQQYKHKLVLFVLEHSYRQFRNYHLNCFEILQ
jgi:hypothetical protein